MIRTVIGGLVAGIIIFVIGFIFWATPLGELAYSKADEAQNAAVQAVARPEPRRASGTGTYSSPPTTARPERCSTPAARSPRSISIRAAIRRDDMSMILPGFIVALIAGLLIAFGLAAVGGRSFGELARLVVCFSLGFTVWDYLGSPIFNHYGWGYLDLHLHRRIGVADPRRAGRGALVRAAATAAEAVAAEAPHVYRSVRNR